MTTYNVPNTFIPGTKAKASEINENFSAVMGVIEEAIEEVKTESADLDLSNLTEAGKKVIFDNSSRSKLIGEIITSSIPLTDSGLHLLDGSLLYSDGVYDSFVQYIAGLVEDNSSLFIDEDDWQQSITNYGVCGKFVYDSTANTVRLPKITGFIEGTTNTAALGELIEAGLPNITGWFGNGESDGSYGGAFYFNGNQSGNTQTGGSTDSKCSFDASRSNSIYGNSTTVQPQSVKVLYYIVVATTAKTDLEVNIDNIATDLAAKTDKVQAAKASLPSNTYVDLTLGASGTVYTAPANGWVYINKIAGAADKYVNIYVRRPDNTVSHAVSSGAHSSEQTLAMYVPVLQGQHFVVNWNATGTTNQFRFIYAEGSKGEA